MKVTRIKMKSSYENRDGLLEIDSIYITGCGADGYYKKEYVYDRLVAEDWKVVTVDIYPYPELIPAKSINGEKYVKSDPNDRDTDNLLRLPRE